MQPSKWNLLWLVPWMLISWIAVELLVWLPLSVLGCYFVPILLGLDLTTERESWINKGQMIQTFKWKWTDELWGNHEDGLCPDWWRNQGGDAWTWYLRNSVNNMRFWPLISLKANTNTHFIGSSEITLGCKFIAWSGPYVGFRWEGSKYGIWIGWAVNPRDARTLLPSDWRSYGYSVVCQVFQTDL